MQIIGTSAALCKFADVLENTNYLPLGSHRFCIAGCEHETAQASYTINYFLYISGITSKCCGYALRQFSIYLHFLHSQNFGMQHKLSESIRNPSSVVRLNCDIV
ncbi:hypothetical protein XENOCAPTIV_009368 [Xenoophorus captivus]|uniref:Uncharacterized protein n=1 Tax=Xenoophorus captivus TaxID=1517983 RepID=A0ABV0S8J2_9TELE